METRKIYIRVILVIFCILRDLLAGALENKPVTALSSIEAEYIAVAVCVKELMYLKALLCELLNLEIQTKLYMTIKSAIKIIKNGMLRRLGKHTDVRNHFLLEQFNNGGIELEYVESCKNLFILYLKDLIVVS